MFDKEDFIERYRTGCAEGEIMKGEKLHNAKIEAIAECVCAFIERMKDGKIDISSILKM